MKAQIFRILMFLALAIYTAACSKDDHSEVITDPKPIEGKEADNFNKALTSLTDFEQPQELVEPEEEVGDSEQDVEDSSLECYTTFYKAAPGFDEMLALDPTSDVIFPGAILKGESIPTGEYVPIIADRSSIILSASLTNISGSPVVKITNPKLSTVREGIKTILDQEVTGATSARINFDISEVYSKEQLNLAIGANYRSAATKVSASFNFESSTYAHKYVLKYLQVYYTIDMDPPKNPSDLFSNVPDISSLGSTSPVYVATVTYGRMIIYTIESNYSRTEIDAAFSASFGSSDGSIESEYEKVINESSIKALVIGGSGGDAAQVVNGPTDVYNYISEGGDYSRESPGAPLSYKLRYLKQGTPVARVVLASEYVIRQCDLAYPIFHIEMDYLRCTGCQDGDGTEAEIFGSISGSIMVGDPASVIKSGSANWGYTRSNYFTLGKDSTKHVDVFAVVELYKPNYNIDYVLMKGKLTERDDGETPFGDLDPDDNFGSAEGRIFLKDITNGGTQHELDFGEVKVGFILKRIQ